MKLLRSTFLTFFLASNVAAFAPQLSSKSQITHSSATTSLFVGIHDQPASKISEEEIKRETAFRQVIKETSMVKDYLDYLIEQSIKSTTGKDGSEEEDQPTLAEMMAEKTAAGEVELFGGSGGDVELFGGGSMEGPTSSDATPNETAYKSSLRTDLGSDVLISGTADATLLNILNNNFFGQDAVPNFEFKAIRALVEDVGAAKKKAISREARYGGLLDKLSIEPAGDALPTKENLAGVGSWILEVAVADAAETLPQIAELAKNSEGLNNVVVMVTGTSSDSVEGWDAMVDASADGSAFKCTLLAVGELYDSATSGGFYHVGKLGEPTATTIDSPSKLSRKKAYQLLAHSLALDCTAGQALVAHEFSPAAMLAIALPYGEGEFAVRDDDGNALPDEFQDVKMESRLIQGIREMGLTMVMELDVLAGKGISAYKEYMEDPPNKETAFTKAKSARDEQDEKIMAELDKQIAKSDARKAEEAAAKKKIEVEGIAKEWAIKEYSLRMLGGDLDESVMEKDFMESVWDQALTEAEMTHERINSVDYIKDQEELEKTKSQSRDKLFWDGMDPMLRKKREKMVEKVKKQYMDLLSEEDLERIILSE